MTSIARLGAEFVSDGIRKGVEELKRLVPAAKSAQDAVEGLNSATGKTGAAVQNAAKGLPGLTGNVNRAASAINQIADASGRMSKANAMAGTAMSNSAAAAGTAFAAYDRLQQRITSVSGVTQRQTSEINRLRTGLISIAPAANDAGSALNRLGKHASDNINRMQATPGNIAAQFQDIGVTAAGGMNPMIIALQQGTQLSAAMSGGLGNLLAGFKQLLGPAQLLTIAFVGFLAAGIQMVDWAALAKDGLNAVANGMDAMIGYVETATPLLLAFAGVLAVAFAPQIIAQVVALSVAIGTTLVGALTAALTAMWAFALANPFSALVLGAAALATAIGIYMGVTIDNVKSAVNFILNGFIGAYNAIKATWSMLPAAIGDIVVQTANSTIRTINNMINAVIDGINFMVREANKITGLGIGTLGNVRAAQFDNPNAGAAAKVSSMASAEMSKQMGVDTVGKISGAIRSGVAWAADKLRGLASGIGAADADKTKTPKAETPKVEKDPWKELLDNADKQQRALEQAGAQVGLYGEALAKLRYEQDLLNRADDAGIKRTAEQTAELERRAAAMAKQSEANRTAEFNEDMTQSYKQQTRALEAARGEIGLTGAALVAYRYEQQEMNKALADHITLSVENIAKIKERAKALGQLTADNDALTESLKKQEEALKFQKETIKGVFTEWVQSVRNGKDVFSSFADAVLNAMNKILDKALDVALDSALNSILGTSGGGILGSILGAKPNALGGVYDNVSRFAKGGSFTNSIVDSPTLFKFAKGTGMMGEAGPEAIMPLKRGSDGSLGVQVNGGSVGSTAPVTNNINTGSTYNIGGVTTPEQIMAAIRQGDAQSQAEMARAIPSIMAEYQRNGTTG